MNKKSKQLGMPFGTASNRLKKTILFHLLIKLKENICFQCNKEIRNEKELSIEHKEPWLDNDTKLFWDINNIAFSHLSCNCRESRRNNGPKPLHGTNARYNHHGCRCDKCKNIERIRRKDQRERGIKT